METVIPLVMGRVLIKKIDHPDYLEFKSQLLDQTFERNAGNQVSVSKRVLDPEQFSGFKKYLEDESTGFMNYFNWPANRGEASFDQLQLTTSWVNKTSTGGHHHEHDHPYSVVSGIVFLSNNPENSNLTFSHPVPSIPYTEFSGRFVLTNVSEMIEPETDLEDHIVLFLSNISHKVNEVLGPDPRFTLSFNTWWSGFLGNPQSETGNISFDRFSK